MCPECQSTERSWRAVSGRGTIWSFVVVHPPVLPAYAPYVPFPVVTVTLAEKPSLRMVGNLVTGPGGDINGVDPATVAIGEAVRVVFTPRPRPDGTEVYLPQWVREPSPEACLGGPIRSFVTFVTSQGPMTCGIL